MAITQRQRRQLEKQKNLQEYVKMMMAMTTAYLACNICIVVAIFAMANTASNSELWLLFKSVMSAFAILNNSGNFFFYLMSGNAYPSSFLLS